jgi:hypothetical protein
MTRLAIPALTLALLGGCAQLNTQVVDPVITALAKINATATADLVKAQKVALAEAPPDQDGFACYASVLVVSGQIAAVMTAAQGPGAGIFTSLQLASAFQPNGAQYNLVTQELRSGCAAKAQDVLGAAGVLAAGGAIGAIASGQILPMLAGVP